MVITIKTAAHGVIIQRVNGSRGAVDLLRKLAADGVKCVSWEVERNVD